LHLFCPFLYVLSIASIFFIHCFDVFVICFMFFLSLFQCLLSTISLVFIRSSWDGPYYVIGYGGWRAVVHTDFRTITLVLYIGSLPNLATWFPCGRGRTLFILGTLGQRSRSPLL
jgi:hypothetical protein